MTVDHRLNCSLLCHSVKLVPTSVLFFQVHFPVEQFAKGSITKQYYLSCTKLNFKRLIFTFINFMFFFCGTHVHYFQLQYFVLPYMTKLIQRIKYNIVCSNHSDNSECILSILVYQGIQLCGDSLICQKKEQRVAPPLLRKGIQAHNIYPPNTHSLVINLTSIFEHVYLYIHKTVSQTQNAPQSTQNLKSVAFAALKQRVIIERVCMKEQTTYQTEFYMHAQLFYNVTNMTQTGNHKGSKGS